MALDEAIQKFAAYARGEGDFDELDLKEVICAEVAERERKPASGNLPAK